MCLMVLSVGCSVWWRRPRQRRWRRLRRWAGLPGPGLATAGAATVVDPTGKGGGVTGNRGEGWGGGGGGGEGDTGSLTLSRWLDSYAARHLFSL